ncbi:hypothetical protein KPH14_008398 [Odynerus spinipes]|uniref:Uncharacterized protein n=1 Tax=Odynerus spinipes TaxID=1348599 RepID=A0AAD9RAJ6_9HYME|nr:hypothetical protein KPH14_008398 [Odynerus spinipes]
MNTELCVNLFLTGIWVFAAVYTISKENVPPPEKPEDTVTEDGWSQFILNRVKQAEYWNKYNRYKNIPNIRMSE